MKTTIRYSFAESPFGEVVALELDGSIVALEFTDAGRGVVLEGMRAKFSDFEIVPCDESCSMPAQNGTRATVSMAERAVEAFVSNNEQDMPPLSMVVGTSFQRSVWSVLQQVPIAERVSYSTLAAMVGKPRAVRAVASAVACNPVSLLIPCHRIVHADGTTGQYRWGASRKRDLLEWEQSQV